MRSISRRFAGAVAAVMCSVSAVAATGAMTPASAAVNTSPKHLVVYDNNTENMLTACGYDFGKLISYMKRQPESPDVFVVQQISNQAQLNKLTALMSRELSGTYKGVIAVANPDKMDGNTCGGRKRQQTNAIVYRTPRLTLVKRIVWRSDAPANPQAGTGPCRNLKTTSSIHQDRVENVAARFYDKQAKKYVAIGSIHWPTNGPWHAHACAAENIREAATHVNSLSASLRILAGDTNASSNVQNWWAKARSYGFRDPIYELCHGSSACLTSRHHTFDTRRIDFILAKGGSGFSRANTVTKPSAGGNYSEHRAVTAYVRY